MELSLSPGPDYKITIMEANVITATNHFFEQKKCSGILIYTVDNSEPSYIKFNTRITLKVMFDNNDKVSNYDLGNRNEFKSQVNDSALELDKMQECDNTLGESGVTDVIESTGKNIQTSSHLDKDVTQNLEDDMIDSFDSPKDVLHNDKDDQTVDTECERSEFSETPSLAKPETILKMKRMEEIRYANSCREGMDCDVDAHLKNGFDSLSAAKNKTLRHHKVGPAPKRARIEPKKLKVRICKDVLKVKSKRIKSKMRKDQVDEGKIKRCKQDIDDETKLSDTEKDSCSVSNERKSKRKQSRPKKVRRSQNIKCDYCNVMFDKKIDFYNHRRTRGSSFKCETCGKVEPFQAHLMVHILSHEPDKGYVDINGERKESDVKRRRHKIKCSVCGLVRSSIDSLKVHMMIHTEESPYHCCVCEGQAFFSLSSLHHHQESHKVSMRFQCKECEMRFVSRTELSKHKFNHEIKCDLCGELFPNKTSRTCHYRNSHPKEVKRCTECLRLFSTDIELQKHILYHRRGKKEQCPVCGIVVTKLKDHMMIHSTVAGENLFACEQCPMKYKRKSSLNKHLLVHTGEKPYACNLCPKKFRSNGMLRKHLLTHTLERPFVCELCGKQFSLRSNLVTHMRVHSETRKFPCPYCLQAFNYKTSLEIHLKCKHNTSDTSLLLSCVHCFQTFQDLSSRRDHMCVGHRTEMTTSNAISQEQEHCNAQEEPLLHEQENHLPQRHQQQLSNVQVDRQGDHLLQKEKALLSQRQEQPMSHDKLDQMLPHDQEQSMMNEQHGISLNGQELTSLHKHFKSHTVAIGQESTYITQESPMLPFYYSNQPLVNQTSASYNSQLPIQNPSINMALNLDRATPLESVTNFPIPTSNVNLGSVVTSSNIMDHHGFKKERKCESSHQNSTISSILSAPPIFHCIPPALEHISHPINFGNINTAVSSKRPSDRQDNL